MVFTSEELNLKAPAPAEPVTTVAQNATTEPAPIPDAQETSAPVSSDLVSTDYLLPGSKQFFDFVKKGLAGAESSNNYFAEAPNSSAHGKYQFLNATRETIMPGVDRNTFLSSPDLQEEAMTRLLQQNLDYAKNKGVDIASMPAADAAGMLWAMHLKGAAEGLRTAQDSSFAGGGDPNGTTPRFYYNKGRQKFLQEAGVTTPDNSQEDDFAQSGLFSSKGNLAMAKRLEGIQRPELYSDYYSKVIDGAKQQTTMGQAQTAYESLNDALSKINKASGSTYQLSDVVPHYTGSAGTTAFLFGPQFDQTAVNFNKLIADTKASNPNVSLPFSSFDDLRPDILKRTQAYEQTAAKANADSGWLTRILGFGAETATAMVSGAPELAATAVGAAIPIGKGLSLLGKAGVSAATAAGLIAPTQYLVQSNRQDMGDKNAGFAQGAENTAIGALGTGVLTAAIEGVSSLLPGGRAVAAGFKNSAKMFTKQGAEDFASAAEAAGIRSIELDTLPKIHETNPAGEGLAGLADLDTKLQKAQADLANGLPVSVVPEFAPVPHLELDYSATQKPLGDMIRELDVLGDNPRAKMLVDELPVLGITQKEAMTTTTDNYRAMVAKPDQPVVSPAQRIYDRWESDLTTARDTYDIKQDFDSYRTKVDDQIAEFKNVYGEDLVGIEAERPIVTMDKAGNEVEVPLNKFHEQIQDDTSFLKALKSCLTGG